jgi:hypothetical protein
MGTRQPSTVQQFKTSAMSTIPPPISEPVNPFNPGAVNAVRPRQPVIMNWPEYRILWDNNQVLEEVD